MNILPLEFQLKWQATLQKARNRNRFNLVDIRPTEPGTGQEQRIIVSVKDEDGFPMSDIKVCFSYSTAKQYILTQDFEWIPPGPYKGDVVYTEGSGQIEHIQGSVINEGQPGGITVYILEPDYESDIVTGMGMLADHTGVHLTFQLDTNELSMGERLDLLERRILKLENASQ